MHIVTLDLDNIRLNHPDFWDDLIYTVSTRSYNEPYTLVPSIIDQCIVDLWGKYFSGKIIYETNVDTRSYRYFKIQFNTEEEVTAWLLKNSR